MKEAFPLGLRTCIYKVPDLVLATKWYSQAFSQKPYFKKDFYVGFNIGGYELGLLPEEQEHKDKSESILCYWGVENIHEVYRHFINCGAKKHEEPTSVGGPLMVASVYDPWRNIIGLIYNPVFELK